MEELRRDLKGIKDVKIEIEAQEFMGGKSFLSRPISIQIFGLDLNVLQKNI